jgi:hypothetical protein
MWVHRAGGHDVDFEGRFEAAVGGGERCENVVGAAGVPTDR